MSPEKKSGAKAARAGNPFKAEFHYNDREQALSTLDSGWAKCALALRTDIRFGHGNEEIKAQSLPRVLEQLEARRTRFIRGDTMEILHAIALCAEENLPLPTWLATAYRNAWEPFLRPGGVESLDGVFFSQLLPTNTAKRAASARLDWKLGGQLYKEVWKVAARHNALDAALTEVLKTKAWGVQKSKARKLVNMVETTHCELSGVQTLSRFWANRRKQVRHK